MKRAGQGTNTNAHIFKVWIAYDPEASRWYVCDSELHGLGLEDDHPGRLLDRLPHVARDLIELNCEFAGTGQIFMLPVFKRGIEIERGRRGGEGMRRGYADVEIFADIGLTEEEREAIFGAIDARR